jgi:phage shock protein C
MKRVISIHLDSKVFQIEEDGYNVLAGLLSNQSDRNRLEKQFSDRFEHKLIGNKTVITYVDVVEVSYSLGFTISDTRRTKKLYRQPKDKIIAGVCAGLGEYFDIDPVILRIIFALFLFIGSFGVYIVIWIVTPKYENARLQ